MLLQLETEYQFARVFPGFLIRLAPYRPSLQQLYIRQDIRIPPHHQSSRLSSLVVRYNDYVNHNLGRARSFEVKAADAEGAFRTDGSKTIYSLRPGNYEEDKNKPFTFELR